MPPNSWLILLSTLSRREKDSASPFMKALLGPESRDKLRSMCLGSAPEGLVGETMEATLMLLVRGDTRGRGSKLVVTGEGVLAPLLSWYRLAL